MLTLPTEIALLEELVDGGRAATYTSSRRVKASHSPFLSAPEQLADIVEAAAS